MVKNIFLIFSALLFVFVSSNFTSEAQTYRDKYGRKTGSYDKGTFRDKYGRNIGSYKNNTFRDKYGRKTGSYDKGTFRDKY